MTKATGMDADATVRPQARDRWDALATLVRVRALVALLALPIGLVLRPDPSPGAPVLLVVALVVLLAVSGLFALGIRLRRGYEQQMYAQLLTDVLAVGTLAAFTGGEESQFVLFFALVVITGGLLGRLPGGLFAAAGTCAAYLALPWASLSLQGGDPGVQPIFPKPGMSIAFLTIVGVLAGVLGERVQRTRDDLERTTQELVRVRVDNDAILRHLTTGVLTVDNDHRIAYLNPAAEQVLGLHGAAVLDQPIGDALPDRLAALRAIVMETLERRTPRARAELIAETASGRPLPLGISTNPLLHDDKSTGVVAVFQDLTEVREMERRVRRNETLAEVGALAAGIAHELRNGLNPISGSVEYLQREIKLEGEPAELMTLISRESQRLNRFVTDLLAYSKERDLAYASVNLNDHLGELCEMVTRDSRRPEKVDVLFEPGDPTLAVRIDVEQMQQVWLNLAINAFQAVGDDGRLTVRWAVTETGRLAIEFEDDGSGIAAEDMSQVGQPFFTTKKGGTGLGLAIAQRIVERHGGSLSLDSAPGRGTIARVALPEAVRAQALAA